MLFSKRSSPDVLELEAQVNQKPLKLCLDTGAQASVMSLDTYKSLSRDKLQRSHVRLSTYTGENIRVLGKSILLVETKSKMQPIEFQVVNVAQRPILGLKACQSLDLIDVKLNVINTEQKGMTDQVV